MLKWKAWAILGATFLLIMAGCLSNSELSSVTDGGEKEFSTLKVVLLPYISSAPFFIGVEEGYFEEQEIKVEFVRFPSSAKSIPALAEGDLDVGAGLLSAGLFNAIGRDLNIKIVAGKGRFNTDCNVGAIVIRKDLFESREITEIAHLKGKKIALSDYLSHGYIYSELFNRDKMSLEDIDNIQLRPSERIGALQSKSIDAAALGEPSITRAVDMGLAVKLIGYAEVYPDFQAGSIIFGPNLLEKNPELGKRFMIAYLKSVRQYNEGKTDRNIGIIQNHTDLDRDLVERSCWYTFDPNGRLNIESLLDLQEWNYKNGYVDELLTEDQLKDESFIEYANKILN
jgi:NitT/TauT family transport system substrate-binding protein